MLERMIQEPGIHVGRLAAELRVDYKTALYHARRLERAGRLVFVKEDRHRSCYPADAPQRPAPLPVAALRALRAGAASPAALGRALGVPRGTAGDLLVRLARRGLATRDGDRWCLAPGVERALAGDQPFS